MTIDLRARRTRSGASLSLNGYRLVADAPRLDRGAVRAALTVEDGGAIVYLSTVNLTSEGSRLKVLATLAGKRVDLPEAALVALDQACRCPPPRADEDAAASPDFSEKVPLDLAGLERAFRRWLLIVDRAFLPVLTGCVLAHGLPGDPVWLLLVAPPGATKTEPIRALYAYPGVFPLSELTARTFASGLVTDGADPSLLARLSSEILTLKDFTTVLEMRADERQAVLAQLRELYDGRYDKAWGTGKELHWEGHLGFLAGVTPVIDRHQGAMSILGERFLLSRLVMPDRRALARKALENAGREEEMRADLQAAMHGFLSARSSAEPAVDDATIEALVGAADFVTRARSGVIRDGYRRELEYAPEPEAPTRFAKMLLRLARGIALAHDSPAVTRDHLALVVRVGIDCLPVIRRRVIAALVRSAIRDDGGDGLSTTDLAGGARYSTQAVRKALEDLQALEIVECRKGGAGRADTWILPAQWATAFEALSDLADLCQVDPVPAGWEDTFSEKTGEAAAHGEDEVDEAPAWAERWLDEHEEDD